MKLRLVSSGLFCFLAASAQNATQPDIWNLSPEQRQTLLAEQLRQMEINRIQTVQLQQQIRAAYASQQVAVQNQHQAQITSIRAQQDTFAARNEATHAALEAGAASARPGIQQDMLRKQVKIVEKSVQEWQPPKSYTASGAPKAALADPFAPKAAAVVESPENTLSTALRGSCLVLDGEHGVAKTTSECDWPSVREKAQADFYPVLEDGSLLDTPERVRSFLALAVDSTKKLRLLRSEGTLMALR